MQPHRAEQPTGPAAGKALRKYLAQYAEPEAARIRVCVGTVRRQNFDEDRFLQFEAGAQPAIRIL